MAWLSVPAAGTYHSLSSKPTPLEPGNRSTEPQQACSGTGAQVPVTCTEQQLWQHLPAVSASHSYYFSCITCGGGKGSLATAARRMQPLRLHRASWCHSLLPATLLNISFTAAAAVLAAAPCLPLQVEGLNQTVARSTCNILLLAAAATCGSCLRCSIPRNTTSSSHSCALQLPRLLAPRLLRGTPSSLSRAATAAAAVPAAAPCFHPQQAPNESLCCLCCS